MGIWPSAYLPLVLSSPGRGEKQPCPLLVLTAWPNMRLQGVCFLQQWETGLLARPKTFPPAGLPAAAFPFNYSKSASMPQISKPNFSQISQYLKILHKASTSDMVSIDLLNVQALRTKKPRNQNLQVLDELIVYFWKQNPTSSVPALHQAGAPVCTHMKQEQESQSKRFGHPTI